MHDVPLQLEDHVPHRGTMSLLTRLLEVGQDHALAEVDIHRHTCFAQTTGVPVWVGIEYMAQTVAAWAGGRALRAGRRPSLGYLLGSRHYRAAVPMFEFGQTLCVHVRCELIGDNGLGQFECRIETRDGVVLAEAMVSVYEPPSAADPAMGAGAQKHDDEGQGGR